MPRCVAMAQARFAVVTLVMRGDRYVPGARVFARSTASLVPEADRGRVDLVCMVTDDVSGAGRAALACDFDRVVDVPYMTAKASRLSGVFHNKYAQWVDVSFTKWNCLGFSEYARVGFFDADCLVCRDISRALLDPQHLARPAGVFSNPWSETVLSLTPERIQQGKKPMRDLYHPLIGTSRPSTLPREPIRQALYAGAGGAPWTGMHFVCAGSSIFFQPFPDGARAFRLFLDSARQVGNPACGGSGPDDQMIVRFLLDHHPVHATERWQLLNSGWCCIPWKPALLQSQGLTLADVHVQHFFNLQKPWEMDRTAFPDLERWWSVHDRLAASPVERASAQPDAGVPAPATHRQLSFLLAKQNTTQHALYLALQSVAGSQLRRYPAARNQLWTELLRLHAYDADDEAVYAGLWTWYHKTLLVQPQMAEKAAEAKRVGATAGRADFRGEEVSALLVQHMSVQTVAGIGDGSKLVLDVGCGNGSITASVARCLSLSREQVDGLDPRPWTGEPPTSFAYTQTRDDEAPWPFPPAVYPVVLALMSLHHVRHEQRCIQRMFEACRPGGLCLIREHDCADPALAPVIDVMHGLYERVWSDPPEQERFCDLHFARYRPRAEWRQKFERAGFVCVPQEGEVPSGRGGSNPARFYYELFTRP